MAGRIAGDAALSGFIAAHGSKQGDMSGITAIDIRRSVIVVTYDTSLGLGDKTFRPDVGVGRLARHDISAGIVAGYAAEAGARSGRLMGERDIVDDTLGYYAEAVLPGDSSCP